ncbi:hypothetical protein BOTBODRAFT_246145 [Botryobasidium botryosum FD-172 SS1]|uniref:Uncharacterized protein n=1 Tax=Botryobasidium botryosum (strain FD-172 SS1) TaxID=930990 RepID=A0A067LTF7_BOTB1|nr:hypothetical protein BOTBODRAFT_246145 [Botryobasidium botryosum FD-172 SS1]
MPTMSLSPCRPAGSSGVVGTTPQQSCNENMPGESGQSGRTAPPSLEDVLAEVDPFLYAIGAIAWRDCVRLLVLANVDRTAEELVQVDTLFKHGFQSELVTTKYSWGRSRYWDGKTYSDKRIFPPRPKPSSFKNRSIPALITLVDLLLLAGVSIDGNLCGIRAEHSAGRRPSLGDEAYLRLDTPLNAVTNEICRVERMMHKPGLGKAHDRDSLLTQLDYMLCVFEVLLKAGASCRPCKHRRRSTLPKHGLLHSVCTSPWQCGPTSHSGRIFSLLLSGGGSSCRHFCELKEAAFQHSAWKVGQLLLASVSNLENDLDDLLSLAVKRRAKSPDEEEAQVEIIRRLAQAAMRLDQQPHLISGDILPEAISNRCGLKVVQCLIDLDAKIPQPTLLASLKEQTCSAEVLGCLARSGAYADFLAQTGATPLHCLLGKGQKYRHQEIDVDLDRVTKVECLIKAGAGINARDKDGRTPLTTYLSSVAVSDAFIVRALLHAGASPNRSNPLYWLPYCGIVSPEGTRLLIEHGADVNKVNKHNGRTPLHALSSARSHIELHHHALSQVFGMLFGSGADVNARDYAGYTPLHEACHCFRDYPIASRSRMSLYPKPRPCYRRACECWRRRGSN